MARFKRAPRRYTKKYSKKRVFRKRFAKKTFRRGRKVAGRKGQTACAHQTIPQSDISDGNVGNRLVALQQFDRLVQLAALYRYYRVTWVEWRYENYFNVAQYAAAAVGGATVPNMYTVMDRQGVFPYTGLAQLQDLGLKGTKFTSIKKVAYAPSVASLVTVNATSSPSAGTNAVVRAMKAPWLPTATPTDPTSTTWANVNHYGHSDYFDNEGIAGSSQVAQLTVTMYVEFKEPAMPIPVGP